MNKYVVIGKVIYVDKLRFDYFNKCKCYLNCRVLVLDKRKEYTYLDVLVSNNLININKVYILSGYLENRENNFCRLITNNIEVII